MSKLPTVATAREIAKRGDLAGVVVIGFGGGSYSIASYGMTKRQCSALKRLNDYIGNAIDEEAVDLAAMAPVGPWPRLNTDTVALAEHRVDEARRLTKRQRA